MKKCSQATSLALRPERALREGAGMELNDDVVLMAVQERGGAFPVTPEDLLNRSSERLIFQAVEDVFVPPDALNMIQRSIDRLEAAGYVAGSRGTAGHRITETGRTHLREIG
jgi:hypothetical protein